MQLALDQFRISITRVRDLIALHNYVKSQATAALDFICSILSQWIQKLLCTVHSIASVT